MIDVCIMWDFNSITQLKRRNSLKAFKYCTGQHFIAEQKYKVHYYGGGTYCTVSGQKYTIRDYGGFMYSSMRSYSSLVAKYGMCELDDSLIEHKYLKILSHENF
jgi:hypothetical protein